MTARILIVVLLALNLGVAAWWLLRPPPALYSALAEDGEGLRLRAYVPPAGQAGDEAAAGDPAESGEPAPCLRIGPFADAAAAQAARSALNGLADQVLVEEVPGEAAGYRVLLPPAADRASAQTLARRIAEAGFQDYMVIGEGAEAHSIALGSYRQRDGAERRLQALRQAGFPAVLRAQGPAQASRWWLEADNLHAGTVHARLDGVETSACLLPRPTSAEAAGLR